MRTLKKVLAYLLVLSMVLTMMPNVFAAGEEEPVRAAAYEDIDFTDPASADRFTVENQASTEIRDGEGLYLVATADYFDPIGTNETEPLDVVKVPAEGDWTATVRFNVNGRWGFNTYFGVYAMDDYDNFVGVRAGTNNMQDIIRKDGEVTANTVSKAPGLTSSTLQSIRIVKQGDNYTCYWSNNDFDFTELFSFENTGIAGNTICLDAYAASAGGWFGSFSYLVEELRFKEICPHESDPSLINETVTKEPTCTEAGSKTCVCMRGCGAFKVEAIPATGHTLDEATKVVKEPSCTEQGYTSYVCSVCGETVQTETVRALGHSKEGESVVTAPTCTEGGYTTYTCPRCGEDFVSDNVAALGHDWTDGEVLEEPGVDVFGKQEIICARCGEKSTKTLLPTNFKLGPMVVADPESPTGYTGKFVYFDDTAKQVYFCGDLMLSSMEESGGSAAVYSPFEYRPGLMRRGGSQFKEPMENLGGGYWYYEVPLSAGANQYWFNTDTITRMIPDPANHPQWSPGSNWNTKDAYNAVYVPYDEKQDNPVLAARVIENPRDDEKVGTWSYVQYDLPNEKGCYMGVYLPYGYDAEREKPYKTIYVLHGGGQDESDWLGIGSVQNIIDNLYANGEIEDPYVLIVPRNTRLGTGNLEATFAFVEENYNVSADRMDRAICGLSMGGMMINNLLGDDKNREEPSFGYYGLFSGGQPSNALTSPHLLDSYYYVGSGLYEGNPYNQALVDSGAPYHFIQFAGAHDFNTWCQMFTDYARSYAFHPENFESSLVEEWKLVDAPEDGGSYIIVADDQYALSGVPGEAGTTAVPVTIEGDKVVGDISDAMIWTFESADSVGSDGSDQYRVTDASGKYLRRVSRTNAVAVEDADPSNANYFAWSLIEREDGFNTFYQNGSSRYAVTIGENGVSSARVSSSSGNILASGSPVKLYTNGKVCEHEWTEEVTAPTCTEGGYTTKTCSKCGKVKITDRVAALGHTPDPETANTVAPTCTERGYTEYVCSVCGETYQADFVNALGHTWGAWETVAEPTCTEAGSEQRVCSVCEEVGTRSIAALGHGWTDGDILVAPTEEEFGVQELICARCGEKSSKSLLPTKYTAGPKVVADPESPTGYTGQFTYYDPDAEVVYFCGDLKLSDITESGNSAATYSPFEYRPGLMRRGGSQFKEPMTAIGNGWWYYELPLCAGANQYWFNTDKITRMIPDPYNHPQWSPASNWNTKDAYNAIYVPYDEKQDNEMLADRAKYENPRDDEKVGTWSYVQYDLPGQPGCYMGVYLPYGYDANREKPYRSIYVLHGAGQDESDWLGIGSVQNIIDNLYADGDIKEAPVLFVLRNSRVGAGNLEATFAFVEENYNVSSDRMERAICGLSMGGMMINNLLNDDKNREEPSFGYYGLFSGGQPSNALSSPHLLKSYYYVANGLYEGNIYNQSLVDSGAFCVFKQYPGAHDFNTWCQEFTDFAKNYAFQPWAFGDGEAPVELDTTDLEAAIAEAEAIDVAPYTDESAAALAEALEAAKAALAADNQADIDAATQALKDAIAALEEKPAEPIVDPEKTYVIVADGQYALNTKSVPGLHSYANSTVTLGATPVTIEDGKVVSKVREGMLWTIKFAEDVPDSYDGNDQYFIYAQDGSMLVRKNGRVNYAPMALGELDPANSYYATWSFTERENAEGAYTMYSNSDRSGQQPMAAIGAEKGFELNYKMWSQWNPQTTGSEIRLYEFDGVAAPDVDTTALEAAIASAEAVDTAPYTDESVAALTDALAAAKALLDGDSQADIDAAAAALNAAIEGLTEKPEEPAEGTWKLAATVEPGKTYVIVADGQYALKNKEVPGLHSYPNGSVTLGSAPVTVEGDTITSQVTKNMLWTVQDSEIGPSTQDGAEQYYIYDQDGSALLRTNARSNYAAMILGEVDPGATQFATWSFYKRGSNTRAITEDTAYTMYSNSNATAQWPMAAIGAENGFELAARQWAQFNPETTGSAIRLYTVAEDEPEPQPAFECIDFTDPEQADRYSIENQVVAEVRDTGLYLEASPAYFDPIGAAEDPAEDVVKVPAAGDWTATLRFRFNGRWGFNSYLGFYAYDDDNNFVGIRASSNNMQDILRKDGEVTANTMAKTPGLTSSQTHQLRIVKKGDDYTCYWSTNNFDYVELFSFTDSGIQGNTIVIDAYSASAGGWFGNFSYNLEELCFHPICAHESDPSLLNESITREPTCTEPGSKTTVCMRGCGAFKIETIPALGHTKDPETAVVTAPTCTEQGYTTYTCPVCGETFVEDRVPATGHTKEGAEAVVTEPTCLEGGYTTYTCPVCGDTFVDDRTAALGHAWVDDEVIVEPGQDTFGKQLQKCSRCDATQTKLLLPLNYKLGPTLVKDPESPTGYTAYFIYQNGDCQQAYFCGDIALKNDADRSDSKTYEPEEYKPGLMRAASITRRPMQKVGADLWVTSVPLAAGANQYWFNLDNNTSYMVPDPANHPQWSPNSNWDTKNAYNALYVPYDPVQDYEPTEARTVENPRDDEKVGTWWYEPVEIDGFTHYMGVYLPYGYDAERAEPYKTIWILHGGGQDESDWMGIGSVQKILDNLIAEGRTEPAVLISPTTNNNMMGGTGDAYANLFEKLIPYVEEKFNVSKDKMDRALGGLSMGSMNTQNIINADTDADKFGYYGPWSGGVSVQTTAKGIEYAHILFAGGTNDFGWGGASAEAQVARMAEQGVFAKAMTVTGAHDFNTWCQMFRIWCEDYLWQPWAFGDGEAPEQPTVEWKLADSISDGGSYIVVADDQYALSGIPGEAGVTAVPVTIEGDKVVGDVTANMIWIFDAADVAAAADGNEQYLISDPDSLSLRRGSGNAPLTVAEYTAANSRYFVWSLTDREEGDDGYTLYVNGSTRYAMSGNENGFSVGRVSSSSGNIHAAGSSIKLYTDGKACEHEWTEEVTPATCTEAGYTTKTCAKCGRVKIVDRVAALGHSKEGDKVVTEPTCTEGGYTTYTCPRCGEDFVSDNVAALGHVWKDGDILVAPTEDEFGVQELICDRCGEKSTKALLPTKYTAGPRVVADSESPTGYVGQFTYYDPDAEQVYFCGDLNLSDINEPGRNAAVYSPFEYRPGLMRRGGSQFKEPMTPIGNGWWYYEVPLSAGANQYWFNTDRITRMIPDPYNHPQWSPASNWNTKDAYNAVYVPYDEKQDNPVLEARVVENPRDDEQVGTWSYVPYELPGQSNCYMGVYLPYGYDAEREKPYKTIYVLHGGGQDESDWLGIGSVQNIIDNLYANGEIKDPYVLIVPRNSRLGTGNLEATFAFVEENYNVSTDRMDRAICGLSMGGMMINNLLNDDKNREEPSFGYYGLFSGGQPSNALNSPHLLKSYYYVGNGMYEGDIYNQALVDSGAYYHFAQFAGAHDFNTWCQMFTDFARSYAFHPEHFQTSAVKNVNKTIEVNDGGYVTAVVYTGEGIDFYSQRELMELGVEDFEIAGQKIYSVFAEEGKLQLNVVPFKSDNVVVSYTGELPLDLGVNGDYTEAEARVLRPKVSYTVQSLDDPLHAGPNICIDPDSPTGYTVKFLFKAPEKAAIAEMEGRTIVGWHYEDVTSVQFNGDLALRNAEDYSDTTVTQPADYQPGLMRAGSVRGEMTQLTEGEWAGYWYYELPLAAGANQYWFYCNGSTGKWYPDPANPAIWGPGCTATYNEDGVITRRAYNSVYVPYDEKQNYRKLEQRAKFETPRTDEYAGKLSWEVIEGEDMTRYISVYLPYDYDENRAEPYKTIYMTPAYDQDESDWFGIGSCQNVMDNLLAEGLAEEAVIVSVVAARDNRFLGLEDTDGDGYWNFEGLFDVVIPYVEANYNVSTKGSDRAIGGHYQTAGQLIRFLGNTEGRSVDEFGYYLMVSTGKGADIDDVMDSDTDVTVPAGETLKSCYFFSNGSTERTLNMGALPEYGVKYIYYQPPGGHDFNCWDQAVTKYFMTLWDPIAYKLAAVERAQAAAEAAQKAAEEAQAAAEAAAAAAAEDKAAAEAALAAAQEAKEAAEAAKAAAEAAQAAAEAADADAALKAAEAAASAAKAAEDAAAAAQALADAQAAQAAAEAAQAAAEQAKAEAEAAQAAAEAAQAQVAADKEAVEQAKAEAEAAKAAAEQAKADAEAAKAAAEAAKAAAEKAKEDAEAAKAEAAAEAAKAEAAKAAAEAAKADAEAAKAAAEAAAAQAAADKEAAERAKAAAEAAKAEAEAAKAAAEAAQAAAEAAAAETAADKAAAEEARAKAEAAQAAAERAQAAAEEAQAAAEAANAEAAANAAKAAEEAAKAAQDAAKAAEALAYAQAAQAAAEAARAAADEAAASAAADKAAAEKARQQAEYAQRAAELAQQLAEDADADAAKQAADAAKAAAAAARAQAAAQAAMAAAEEAAASAALDKQAAEIARIKAEAAQAAADAAAEAAAASDADAAEKAAAAAASAADAARAQAAAQNAQALAEAAQAAAEAARAAADEAAARSETSADEAALAEQAAKDAAAAAEAAKEAAAISAAAAENSNVAAAEAAAQAAKDAADVAKALEEVAAMKRDIIIEREKAQAAALGAAKYYALNQLALAATKTNTNHMKPEQRAAFEKIVADANKAIQDATTEEEVLKALEEGLDAVSKIPEDTCPSRMFVDAPEQENWAHAGIDYCVENGLMKGVSETVFNPTGSVTRAQLVTILYRMAGEPAVEFKGTFSDVAEGLWYSDAIEWAAANGVVNGIGGGKFAPDGKITREQIAAILYRYSGSPKAEGSLAAFPDAASVSDYAVDAMIWATSMGLINGIAKDGQTILSPKTDASRAQIASIIMRYAED